jgi:hypothetical protein
MMRESMLAKHVGGFFTLLFFGVIVDPDMAKRPLHLVLLITLLLYAWFIMTVRSTLPFVFLTLLLLLSVYILRLLETRRLAADEAADVSRFRLGQKEYGEAFTLTSFVFGRTKCRNYTPDVGSMLCPGGGVRNWTPTRRERNIPCKNERVQIHAHGSCASSKSGEQNKAAQIRGCDAGSWKSGSTSTDRVNHVAAPFDGHLPPLCRPSIRVPNTVSELSITQVAAANKQKQIVQHNGRVTFG